MKVLKKIDVGEQELNTEIKRLACAKELIFSRSRTTCNFSWSFISSQSSIVQHQIFEIILLKESSNCPFVLTEMKKAEVVSHTL